MNQHEMINYVELPAKDFGATQKFFGDVFGWTFEAYGDQYLAFDNAGLDGGFYASDLSASAANGSALVIFYSERLEETRAKINQAGGTVVAETFEFPGGRRFHFCDPNGNEFAVWSDQPAD
jgi:predicted enzyme related to lactoylglutathione lyase